MTLLGYSWGGGRNSGQDRLKGEFSGNVNKRLQFGAQLDYLYSKGGYDRQALKISAGVSRHRISATDMTCTPCFQLQFAES